MAFTTRFIICFHLIVFSKLLAVDSVGFLFFGDSGTGQAKQYQVARGMHRFCQLNTCEFALLLGDNIYPNGVISPSDSQWNDKFINPYGILQLNFRPALGNHDYHGNELAQIDFSDHCSFWDMPARYYAFQHGQVAFFALDTNRLDTTQLNWLSEQLSATKAQWKIVYAHHPIYSYGMHGHSQGLIRSLRPILEKHGVDFHLSGHDHDKQLLYSNGIHYMISGAAAKLRPTNEGSKTLFASSSYGFAHLWLQGSQASLKFLDEDGKPQFEKTFEKPPAEYVLNP